MEVASTVAAAVGAILVVAGFLLETHNWNSLPSWSKEGLLAIGTGFLIAGLITRPRSSE